jgi:hypothetical protein
MTEIAVITRPDGSSLKVYILMPGENFPRFGGSSRGLTVTKTPSLIISENGPWGRHDTEYDIHNKKIWAFILRHAANIGHTVEIASNDVLEV